MESNLKVRAFEKCNVCKAFRKQALGFVFRLSSNFKDELLVVPRESTDGSEPLVSMLYGNGHIRSSVKESFRKDLGTETPTFAAVYEYYSKLGEKIKDKVIKGCCG